MATKKYSDIDLSKYNKGYQASQDVKNAQKLKKQAENAVKNYGKFNYSNQAGLQAAMDAITNRKAFSYDLNADALYQQYKDNYMAQGRQAMMDATGQAAALTGGYGNSYANTVGNQAYQGYLQQLNNIVPDLYNLALATYQSEGDRLATNYGILSADRDTEYGQWYDKYGMLVNDRGYYADNYNNAYNQDYAKYSDNRSYDQTQYWNEYNAGYQADRDAIADAQWQKQFDESVRQYDEQMAFSKAQASRSSSSGSSSDSEENNLKNPTEENNLKNPTEEQYSKALWLYENRGEIAMLQYTDTIPDVNTKLILDYCNEYGAEASEGSGKPETKGGFQEFWEKLVSPNKKK